MTNVLKHIQGPNISNYSAATLRADTFIFKCVLYFRCSNTDFQKKNTGANGKINDGWLFFHSLNIKLVVRAGLLIQWEHFNRTVLFNTISNTCASPMRWENCEGQKPLLSLNSWLKIQTNPSKCALNYLILTKGAVTLNTTLWNLLMCSITGQKNMASETRRKKRKKFSWLGCQSHLPSKNGWTLNHENLAVMKVRDEPSWILK